MAGETAYQPGVVGKFPFDHEIATFRARLPEMLAEHEGAYVVIRGGEVAGYCETIEAAMWMGRSLFGLEGFMLRQVVENEPVVVLRHELAGWRS